MSRDHRKPRAFVLADELTLKVYEVTGAYPRSEVYTLVSQMRRAALSVPANIVEGCARESQADYVRFLVIAQGSLRELGYYIGLSRRLGYLSPTVADSIVALHETTSRTLGALVRSLGTRTPPRSQDPPDA